VGEKGILDLNLLAEWRNEDYGSARLFKEKVKIWHDKNIKRREFKIVDQVLLFNSRSSSLQENYHQGDKVH
jgi:hypothetical protein